MNSDRLTPAQPPARPPTDNAPVRLDQEPFRRTVEHMRQSEQRLARKSAFERFIDRILPFRTSTN